MKIKFFSVLAATALFSVGIAQASTPLGLPPVPIPDNNPQTEAKIKLGPSCFMTLVSAPQETSAVQLATNEAKHLQTLLCPLPKESINSKEPETLPL